MLFNSYEFIGVFLPITLAGLFVLSLVRNRALSMVWLLICSLSFYAYWRPEYLILLVLSILVNFAIARTMDKAEDGQHRKWALIFGVSANLGVLGFYKYANFFIDNVNASGLVALPHHEYILPIGISFYTFQQIAYLVDTYQRKSHSQNLLDYALFVSFFPQLIAGPIVHHKQMMPQFANRLACTIHPRNISIGATIFAIGLAKKVLLADTFAEYATPIFSHAEAGNSVTMAEGWIGMLTYTFQLYFDFSGYSDMAIGLGRMMGIRLPVNFNSPYKSANITDFWRRWHITLSTFLRDYLYIPLGGNRKGATRRYVNLMITMVLGGLWHGAGWNFVIWGTLHGTYLLINHAFIEFTTRDGKRIPFFESFLWTWVGRGITFFFVMIAWVFFRAVNFDGAIEMLQAIFGLNGIELGARFGSRLYSLVLIALGLGWVFLMPNTQQLMAKYRPLFKLSKSESNQDVPGWLQGLRWQPTIAWAAFTSFIFLFALFMIYRPTEFIYFQF